MNIRQKEKSFLYSLVIISIGIVYISMVYFSCGSTTEEVIKVEQDTAAVKAAQDSAARVQRMHQVDIDFNFAYQYYSHKDFRDAIPHYWEAIKNDRELRYPGLYRQLGQSYIEMEEPDSAQMVYEMGVEKVPDDVYIHERLEWIYEAKSEFEKAIVETEKTLKLGGDKQYYLTKLKDLYIRNNQIQEAINVYDQLIALSPDNKELQDQKTNLIKLSGGSIIEEYKKMHEKYPNDRKYIEALMVEYHQENDNVNIISMADKLLVLEPENISALDMKSDAYANLQKWKDRINVLRQRLDIKRDNPETLCDIAESYNILKEYETARSYATRAIRIDGNYGMAYIRIGEAYEFCAEDMILKRGGFSKIRFDDKLIYELANEQYRKASNYTDLSGIASRRMSAIKNSLPTKEDRFMNPDQTKANNPEYQWIYK